MKKLIIALSVILFFVVIAVLLPHIVDINKYKTQVVEQINHHTGLNIAIDGDINLSVLPDTGLVIHDISVQELADGKKLDVSVKKVLLKLDILKFFQGEYQLKKLILDQPTLSISGQKNTFKQAQQVSPDLDQSQESIDKKQQSIESSLRDELQYFDDVIADIAMENFEINNGFISVLSDKQEQLTISNIDIQTSLVKGANPIKLSLSVDYNGMKFNQISLDGNYTLNPNFYVIDPLRVSFDHGDFTVQFSGDFRSIIPEIRMSTFVTELDLTFLDRWSDIKDEHAKKIEAIVQSPATENQPAVTNVAMPFSWNNEEIDFSSLKSANIHYNLRFQKLAYRALKLEDVESTIVLRNDKLTISQKPFKAFGGTISSDIGVDVAAPVPTYIMKAELNDIKTEQLSDVELDIPFVQGIVSASFNGTSQGKTSQEIINNLNGLGALDGSNGVVQGVDLFSLAGNDSAPLQLLGKLVRKTIFDQLKATYTVDKGVLNNDDLSITSKAAIFEGKGVIDLNAWSIDYRIVPKLGQKQGQEGLAMRFPINIQGSLTNPKIAADVISPINTIIQDPDSAKDMVRSLRDDFKRIKNDLTDGVSTDMLDSMKGLLDSFGR